MFKVEGFIYLACPYSTSDDALKEHRVKVAFHVTARIMKMGNAIFSPLTHTHDLGKIITASHDFWMLQDIAILRHASLLVVLCLPGWDESKGVREEIAVAHACRIPVVYINEDIKEIEV